MNWISLLAIIAMIFSIWWLFFRKAKPLYYREVEFDKVAKAIEDLDAVFAPESSLFISHEESALSIQLVKMGGLTSPANLSFSIPDVPWSHDYFELFKQEIENKDINCSIKVTEGGDIPRFLEVERIKNPKLAIEVVRSLSRVMGLDENETYCMHYEGYHDPKLVKEYIKNAKKEP